MFQIYIYITLFLNVALTFDKELSFHDSKVSAVSDCFSFSFPQIHNNLINRDFPTIV